SAFRPCLRLIERSCFGIAFMFVVVVQGIASFRILKRQSLYSDLGCGTVLDLLRNRGELPQIE
ncbi:hypothetical protein, partial [Bacillus subtilis]|uniref:hypothetical protein n=1 Tax=Bacillus subtilis TaxID=1423 RepID=UPI003F85E453